VQYRLDKRALSVMHLKAIARVYGDAGDRVLELLRKNPAGAISVILARLKQKAVEWGKARQNLDKQWKEVLEKNYQKSLDHRSFYFKTSDRKAVMAKTMLTEAKVAKHQAELKEAKKKNKSTVKNTDSSKKEMAGGSDQKKETGGTNSATANKGNEQSSSSSSSDATKSGAAVNRVNEQNAKMTTKKAVTLLSRYDNPVTTAHRYAVVGMEIME
jgi:paired amphipathic helix protein Sin3a